jgi:KAP family P-loop domain
VSPEGAPDLTSGESVLSRPRVARLRMLSDAPLRNDRRDFFGYGVFADAVAELIGSEGIDTPLALAISGPWGAGKTSLAHMIEDRLRARALADERESLTCWFDAWMHDDAPHLGAALAAQVARTASRNRPLWRRLLSPLPAAMVSNRDRWRRRVWIGVLALISAFTALSIHPLREVVESIPGMKDRGARTGSATAFMVILEMLASRLSATLENIASFVDDPASEAARGSIAEVSDQLRELIGQVRRNARLIVIVDNLERCTPERAMEVCEVANQLLSHSNLITIFVADMHLIAKAAEEKFADASLEGGAGRRYLEKIVQLQLTLPPPKADDLGLLLSGGRPSDARISLSAKETAPLRRHPLRALVDTSAIPTMLAEDRWLGIVVLGLGAIVGLRFGLAVGALGPGAGGHRSLLGGLLGTGAPLTWVNIVNGLAYAVDGATAFGIGFPPLLTSSRNQRARRKREVINGLIHTEIDNGTPQGSIQRAVLAQVKPTDAGIVDKLIGNYLIFHAEELEGVEDVIMQFPASLPRGAKRMLNHARLLTQIARNRRLFGGDPDLTPEHLGVWIVLSERWPTFARRVVLEPAYLGYLQELAPDPERFIPLTKDLSETERSALARLLCLKPGLGGVATRLVHFEH